MKIEGTLVIELTRKCNMNCPHCLRGCAQNLDISKQTINNALKHFSNITSLTLTGGEPSLVPELIKYTVERVMAMEIDLGCLYIVTNGKTYSQKMVNAMRRAYEYSYEPDMCALTVSVDEYHDGTHKAAWYRYMDEPFFRRDKEQPDLSKYLINEGNAFYNGIGRRNLRVPTALKKEYVSIYDDRVYLEDDLLYVNAIGDVLLNCDVSYENQSDYTIGNVNDSNLVDIVMAHIVS